MLCAFQVTHSLLLLLPSPAEAVMDRLFSKFMEDQELERELEGCRFVCPFAEELRRRLEQAARRRARSYEQLRPEEKAAVAAAKNKTELRSACVDWLKGERKLDELDYAMQWRAPDDDAKLRAKIKKPDMWRKPHVLASLMAEVEAAHPWTRALANCLDDVVESLDR